MNRAEALAIGQEMLKELGDGLRRSRHHHHTGLRYHIAGKVGGHNRPCGCPRCKRARLAEISLYLAADRRIHLVSM